MRIELSNCQRCGTQFHGKRAVCGDCASLLPKSLIVALTIKGTYRIETKSGSSFSFADASVYGDFVHLEAVPDFPHGVDVRISEITFCADLGPTEEALS